MLLTLRNSEEQAMFDAMMVAGWEIMQGQHVWCIKAPNGVMFAVQKLWPERPIMLDIFDEFIKYREHKSISI